METYLIGPHIHTIKITERKYKGAVSLIIKLPLGVDSFLVISYSSSILAIFDIRRLDDLFSC